MLRHYPLKHKYLTIYQLVFLPLSILLVALSFYYVPILLPIISNYEPSAGRGKAYSIFMACLYLGTPFLISVSMNRILYFLQPKSEIEKTIHNHIKFFRDENSFEISSHKNTHGNKENKIILIYYEEYASKFSKSNYVFLNGKQVGVLEENDFIEIQLSDSMNVLGVYSKSPFTDVYKYNYTEVNSAETKKIYAELIKSPIWGHSVELLSAQKGEEILKNINDKKV